MSTQRDESAKERAMRIVEQREVLQIILEKAKAQQTEQYNKSHKDITFHVGDHVMCFTRPVLPVQTLGGYKFQGIGIVRWLHYYTQLQSAG